MSSDPFGIDAANSALQAALEAREAAIVECVLDERWTQATAADVFGVSRQRIGQIVNRHLARARRNPVTPAQRLAEARETYRLALHAQQLRAEAYGMGYQAETAAFHGDESVAQAEVTEVRLKWRDFAREYRAEHLEQSA